ncbi:10496_t:CDS:1, partial [Acaulospora morrowiae]
RTKILDILKDLLPTPRNVLIASGVKKVKDDEIDENVSNVERDQHQEVDKKEMKDQTINVEKKDNENNGTTEIVNTTEAEHAENNLIIE